MCMTMTLCHRCGRPVNGNLDMCVLCGASLGEVYSQLFVVRQSNPPTHRPLTPQHSPEPSVLGAAKRTRTRGEGEILTHHNITMRVSA